MSKKTFQVANSLKDALLHFKAQAVDLPSETKTGLIAGLASLEDTWLTYCVSAAAKEELIPHGLSAAGVYFLQPESDEVIVEVCANLIKKKTGKMLVLVALDDGSLKASCMDMKSKKLFDADVSFIDRNQLLNALLVLRLNGRLSLHFSSESSDEKTSGSIASAFNKLESECKSTTFSLKNSSFALSQKSVDKSKTVADLYGYMEDDELKEIDGISAPADLKKKMKDKLIRQRVGAKIPLEFSVRSGQVSGDVASSDAATEIVSSGGSVSVPLYIDVPLLVQKQLDLASLARTFSTALLKQLKDLQAALINFSDLEAGKYHVPKPYIFWPVDSCASFLTVIYPAGRSDDELESTRRELHLRLLLPTDKPVIRKCMTYRFPSEIDTNEKLQNVHVGLGGSVKGGKVALVRGNYTYYHYTQDRMDDSGWGCAYRSLQTIISWFRQQGYINSEIPSHKQIQQVLVDIGDKPANFVGSQKWIGSQEVGFVLNQLYGIVSKVMFVSSGKDLPSKARELFHHFETQGTPVMIGGGVLAHTIIGVDFNEDTGEVKYLVLDPHYTGAEDLTTIQKKGWCGWKLPKFWRDDSFYNLCLPQRPLLL